MAFLDENYLLESETAKKLYEKVKDLPVVDAHNHGDVQEIVENEAWNDIWEVEGATDHYVWELMRRRGVPEEKVTGSATNKDKWLALAEIFPELAGNPTYEWIHLDLKHRFGIDDIISAETAEVIWEKTKEKLSDAAMKPVRLLKDMNVKIMCTTDDPDSDLKYHQMAREQIDGIKILPTWRPDKAMNIEKESWVELVKSLAATTGVEVTDLNSFLEALQSSHDFFDEMGCVASDHGVKEPVSYQVDIDQANSVFSKAWQGESLTEKEINDFKAFMLVEFAKMNEASDWVMQLHIGAVRDYRDKLYEEIGADAGGDITTNQLEVVDNLYYLVNKFDGKLEMVLYYLDPVVEPALTTIVRAFPNLNLGAPWWFNDSPYGMARHLQYISSVDLLSNHAGMVTDSRKLMSYDSRTEMFRRTACNVLANMVNRGQMPFDVAAKLAVSMSYDRPYQLFFEGKMDK